MGTVLLEGKGACCCWWAGATSSFGSSAIYVIDAVVPFAADGGEGRLLVCCGNAPQGQVCLARWSLLLEATILDGPQIEVSQP